MDEQLQAEQQQQKQSQFSFLKNYLVGARGAVVRIKARHTNRPHSAFNLIYSKNVVDFLLFGKPL